MVTHSSGLVTSSSDSSSVCPALIKSQEVNMELWVEKQALTSHPLLLPYICAFHCVSQFSANLSSQFSSNHESLVGAFMNQENQCMDLWHCWPELHHVGLRSLAFVRGRLPWWTWACHAALSCCTDHSPEWWWSYGRTLWNASAQSRAPSLLLQIPCWSTEGWESDRSLRGKKRPR